MSNGVSEQFTRINAEGARGDLLIVCEDILRIQISDHIS
jgi:hypothetical protein